MPEETKKPKLTVKKTTVIPTGARVGKTNKYKTKSTTRTTQFKPTYLKKGMKGYEEKLAQRMSYNPTKKQLEDKKDEIERKRGLEGKGEHETAKNTKPSAQGDILSKQGQKSLDRTSDSRAKSREEADKKLPLGGRDHELGGSSDGTKGGSSPKKRTYKVKK